MDKSLVSPYNNLHTRYHKIHARSRTEARWAVFFDVLQIPYTYEAEDTYLSALQKRYLPDFYLSAPSPVGRVVVEIKGAKPTEIEQEKCYNLCNTNGLPVLLINGSPYFSDYNIELFHAEYDMLQCKVCGRLMFPVDSVCMDCGNKNPDLIDYHWDSKVVRTQQVEFNQYSLKDEYLIGAGSLPIAYSHLDNALKFAFILASHARFEFLDLWKLHKYDSIAINPAYHTQGWDDNELLYNCLEGYVPLKALTECARFTINDYINFYEWHYYDMREGRISKTADSWLKWIPILRDESDYLCNNSMIGISDELDMYLCGYGKLLELEARRIELIVDSLPIMPGEDIEIKRLVLNFLQSLFHADCLIWQVRGTITSIFWKQ